VGSLRGVFAARHLNCDVQQDAFMSLCPTGSLPFLSAQGRRFPPHLARDGEVDSMWVVGSRLRRKGQVHQSHLLDTILLHVFGMIPGLSEGLSVIVRWVPADPLGLGLSNISQG
jgi:hypothetical protein